MIINCFVMEDVRIHKEVSLQSITVMKLKQFLCRYGNLESHDPEKFTLNS